MPALHQQLLRALPQEFVGEAGADVVRIVAVGFAGELLAAVAGGDVAAKMNAASVSFRQGSNGELAAALKRAQKRALGGNRAMRFAVVDSGQQRPRRRVI